MSQPQAKPTDGPSPTVRVMRLYKPPLHSAPCMPHLTSDQLFKDGAGLGSFRECTSDFTLSQFILLPDSFGDIYLGEVFAAYISVVNGVDTSYTVSLSARLQTLNATHDLFDSRAVAADSSGAKTLKTHESVDMVVQHPLSELGTHTLRVLVSYTDTATNESKTLRKFYRFNVLNPLKILGTCYNLGEKLMVQSQVVNMTKSPIYVEKVDMILAANDLQADLVRPLESLTLCGNTDSLSAVDLNLSTDSELELSSMPLLGPDESYSYAFTVTCTKSNSGRGDTGEAKDSSERELRRRMQKLHAVGLVEVHWSANMGEHARARSEEIKVGQKVTFPLPSIPVQAGGRKSSGADVTAVVGSPQPLGGGMSPEDRSNSLIVTAVSRPEKAMVGQPCVVTVRVSNHFTYPIISQLQVRLNHQESGLAVVGLSCHNLGALDADDSVDVDLSVLPLNGGMHILSGLVAIDLTTRNEFRADSLCEIMAYDELLSSSNDTTNTTTSSSSSD